MLKLETKTDLEALHQGNVKEGSKLEYKASDAVDKKNDAKKVEMARDISSFANAQGGQIVYGMTEKEHAPAGLDAGLDPKEYPEIWFEQVLQQHITPAIVGLRIYHVPISKKRVAVVIQIPATDGDPHQASDCKYYRRHNFNRLAMEHYEVRDMFRRATAPSLFVRLSLPGGNNASLDFRHGTETSKPVVLKISVWNRSNQPAFHTQVLLGIDRRISILNTGAFTHAPGRPEQDDESQNWLVRLLTHRTCPSLRKEKYPLPTRELISHSHHRVHGISSLASSELPASALSSIGPTTNGMASDTGRASLNLSELPPRRLDVG